MKSEDRIKQLAPGVVMGVVLGGLLNTLAGVNSESVMPNVINAILGCAIPTLLNGTIVLKGTSKILERKLSIGSAFVRNIPYILVAALLGFLYSFVVLHSIMHVDLCSMPVIVNTILLSILGIIVSTVLAFFAMLSYEKAVKYTKRDAKKKK